METVGRRLGIIVLAALLGGAASVAPPTARVALGAGTLRVQADATYTLDPEAGRVRVAIEARVTSLKPNSASFIYFYRATGFALQPEARSIRVTGGASSITTTRRDGYIEGVVRFRSNLYYRDSTTFTIRYDLPGGEPRSESPIRVGKAFATFHVWGWGDDGRGTVEVRTPAGFQTRYRGDLMRTSIGADGGQVLTASPAEPARFFTIISSENEDAYLATRISLEGGVEIVVRAWPEDPAWDESVGETLRQALPGLRDLIGLDWPVAHDLDVLERYTPALEGYAGVFFTDEQRIEVSEDLDPLVVTHEASHAWFNDDLFVERWIYEGLAEEYAWRVQTALGGDAGDPPAEPEATDPGFVDLAIWTHPQAIRDQETDDRERYGYEASFWVIHQLVESVGLDAMRSAFAGAKASVTAYPGAGDPETVISLDNWRRLIDLAQPLDQDDAEEVDAALRAFVLGPADEEALDDRATARAAYRALLDAGDGWQAPWYVREQLGIWAFDEAATRMDEANAVLRLRDEIAASATSLGLDPDDALRRAYEDARDGLAAANDRANLELAALAAIEDARELVEAEPDFVAHVGLLGATPRVPYEAARAAFESGEPDRAIEAARLAAGIISGAPALGQERLVLAAVVAAGVLLLFLLAVLLIRRGRRRRAAALAPAASAPETIVPGPEATEAYATLAADAHAAPPTSSPGPPDHEGGPARGEPSPDP